MKFMMIVLKFYIIFQTIMDKLKQKFINILFKFNKIKIYNQKFNSKNQRENSIKNTFFIQKLKINGMKLTYK